MGPGSRTRLAPLGFGGEPAQGSAERGCVDGRAPAGWSLRPKRLALFLARSLSRWRESFGGPDEPTRCGDKPGSAGRR